MELRMWAENFIKKNPIKYLVWLCVATLDNLSLFIQGLIISFVFDALDEGTHNKAILFVMATIIFMLSRIIIFLVEAHAAAKTKILIEQEIKVTLFEQIYAARRDSAKVSQGQFLNIITTDTHKLADYIGDVWINFPSNIIFTLVAIAILLYTDYKMTTVIFVPLVLLTIVCNMLGEKIQSLSISQRDAEAEFSEKVADVYQNLLSIKLFGIWDIIAERLQESNVVLKKADIKSKLMSQLIYYITDVSYYIGVVIILLASIFSPDGFQLGKYTLFEYALSLVSSTFMAYSMAVVEKESAKVAWSKIKSIGDFIDLRKETVEKMSKPNETVENDGILHISDFKLPYGNRNVMSCSNNFEIKLGKINVIIGKTGSGKTTLIKALLGLVYHDGYVNYQGKKYRDLSEMHGIFSIGYSPQEAHLFQMSLKDNISMWRNRDTNRYDDIVKLVELGQDIWEFSLEEKEDIGKSGDKLSGGQKLRLSLARMLFANKDIYVIDDMSSAIDRSTFVKIWNNIITRKKRNETFIIVSNDEYVVNNAEHIVEVY